MSNSYIENILYSAGLTAQGCWDELDEYAKQGIIRAIEFTAKECSDICMSQADRRNIRRNFGLVVESTVQYSSPDLSNSVQSQYHREINIPKGD